MERIKGVMFRSKAQWYEEGEKSSKYFFSLEKAKYNAKTCYRLITDKGEELTSPHKILEEQRHFYQSLYSNEEDVKFTMTNNFGVQVT